MKKNKIKIKILLGSLIFAINLIFQSPVLAAEILSEAHILHSEKSYAIYEFSVATNLPSENLTFEWVIDEQKIFYTSGLRYFFLPGEHLVKLTVKDAYGNAKYDSIKLAVSFWSLRNNWFLWALYYLAIVVLIYYFGLKLYYLRNKKKIKGQIKYFLELLDEHGWFEKIVSQEVRKKK